MLSAGPNLFVLVAGAASANGTMDALRTMLDDQSVALAALPADDDGALVYSPTDLSLREALANLVDGAWISMLARPSPDRPIQRAINFVPDFDGVPQTSWLVTFDIVASDPMPYFDELQDLGDLDFVAL